MPQPLELAIRGTGTRIALDERARITIGRAGDCEVHVEDHAVSRRHCTLEARGTDLVLTDLDSANGTFLNDRLVRTATVHPGDVIRVGGTELEIGTPASGPAAPSLGDDRMMDAVLRRRFEPERLEWLDRLSSRIETGAADLGLFDRIQRHLSMLHRTSEALAAARDLDGLADAILDSILAVTGGDRAAVVLRRQDPRTGAYELVAARVRAPDAGRFTVSRTIVSEVIEKGLSTFARDAVNDSRFLGGDSVAGQRIRSVMCVPLRTTDQILGAVYVDSVSAPDRFVEADLELLAALGNQAGVALHRVRLMGELERLLLDTIRAIAATIDAKDGYTQRHSERVAALARRIGREMGLGPDEQRTAELAALLHDVGKIAVPDSILNKPGRLNPAEAEEMKKHPLHGARILANIQSASVAAILPGVQHHHERWDGSGYPDGLRGEAIPLLARLLGAADFLDALTSARSYRPASTLDDALERLERGAGSHFDPRVVEAAVRLHRRGELVTAEAGLPGIGAGEPVGIQLSGAEPGAESGEPRAPNR